MQIFKLEHGMYKIIVNTKERWCNYRVVICDNLIKFHELDDECNDVAIWSVPNPFPTGIRFLQYEQQDKDQVVLVFIPSDILLQTEDINYDK